MPSRRISGDAPASPVWVNDAQTRGFPGVRVQLHLASCMSLQMCTDVSASICMILRLAASDCNKPVTDRAIHAGAH